MHVHVVLATFSIDTTTLGCNAVKPSSAHNMQVAKAFGKRVDKLVLNNEGVFFFLPSQLVAACELWSWTHGH